MLFTRRVVSIWYGSRRFRISKRLVLLRQTRLPIGVRLNSSAIIPPLSATFRDGR